MNESRKVYSVSALNRRIKLTLEDEIGHVWVEGEISGFKVYSSGHAYFTLKDADAEVSAVIFGFARNNKITMSLGDGKKVRVLGALSVYEKRGQYQLNVQQVEAVGDGDLMARFLELKERLKQEGLFDHESKLPLPLLPQRIGIITSPVGDVIHDMLTVMGRRFPNLQIRLVPVKVQGAGAAEEIAAAIELFNRVCGTASEWPVDLLIIGRGGGSLEDLWPFNEEVVARAVAASRIPVVSAVGHDTDVMLSDFAADLRAPTPSAAAEMTVPLKSDLLEAVARHKRSLRQALHRCTGNFATRLSVVRASRYMRQPHTMLEQPAQQLDTLSVRLAAAMRRRVHVEQSRLTRLNGALALMRERRVRRVEGELRLLARQIERNGQLQVERRRARLQALGQQMKLLSPLAVLERGYSLTRTVDGALVRSRTQAVAGAVLVTQVADGTIRSVTQES